MKIIKPTFEIIENGQNSGDKVLAKKHIELCGRVCYKSEDKITENSYEKFWNDVVVKRQHKSIMEHATESRKISSDNLKSLWDYMYNLRQFDLLKYFKIFEFGFTSILTGNLRAWEEFFENLDCGNIRHNIITAKTVNIEDYNQEDFYRQHKFVTVKFTTDTGISHELVRHRVQSFSQESSRFCSYSETSKNQGITFIDIDSAKNYFKLGSVSDEDYNKALEMLNTHYESIDQLYTILKDEFHFPAEWCRTVLPKITKTEIVVSGYLEDDWDHFFDLRLSPTAHPQMRELVIQLDEEFKSRGWR
jgi:thymidylate synthase (FAD)